MFSPPLPSWKQDGIETFAMGTYTKIFLQFPSDKVFWNTSYQFLLYADPDERGYYPVFQSLDAEGFLPSSGILFVTVVQSQSYRVESQTDAQTKAEVLAVLRRMYGGDKVPDPTAFMYPRWSLEPWAYGSYSNWPSGTTLEMHQNLRANVERLWFAGSIRARSILVSCMERILRKGGRGGSCELCEGKLWWGEEVRDTARNDEGE